MTVRAQNIRVGAFVLISIGILALFVFFVGKMESKFQANYHIRAQFQNVSGLEEGADVRIGGLRKGAVRKIELPSQPNGKITVIIDLARQTRNLVKQDSVASIKSEGLVGNKYVEVSFGSDGSQPVQSDGTIGSEPPLDISDLIGKSDQLLDSAKGSLDNLQAAAQNITTITGKINSGRGTVGALLNDKSVYQEASASASALHQDADALKHNFLLRGFFNKRGFADPAEIQKPSIKQLPEGELQKVFTFESKHFFDDDSAKLKNEKSLKEAGEFLQTMNPALAVVESSAGPKGESAKDRELSQARAYAVRSYLLDHFTLDDARLKIIGVGKSKSDATLRILAYSRQSQADNR